MTITGAVFKKNISMKVIEDTSPTIFSNGVEFVYSMIKFNAFDPKKI